MLKITVQGEKEVEHLPIKKSEITAKQGLDSQQFERREYMKENVSLHVIKTEKFPAYAAILLFYFGRAFVTSYGWGGSQMYVSAKDDECSDYFSQPYMHVLLSLSLFFFIPHVPSPNVFIRSGSQAAPFGITSDVFGVIPFRSKIDPLLKCVPLVHMFVLI